MCVARRAQQLDRTDLHPGHHMRLYFCDDDTLCLLQPPFTVVQPTVHSLRLSFRYRHCLQHDRRRSILHDYADSTPRPHGIPPSQDVPNAGAIVHTPLHALHSRALP